MDKEALEELKMIRKLLIASLLRNGIDTEIIAKILGFKSKSSITMSFLSENCGGRKEWMK